MTKNILLKLSNGVAVVSEGPPPLSVCVWVQGAEDYIQFARGQKNTHENLDFDSCEISFCGL
jgi:hypothetical protein